MSATARAAIALRGNPLSCAYQKAFASKIVFLSQLAVTMRMIGMVVMMIMVMFTTKSAVVTQCEDVF